jgi:uncharacterized protein (DUF1501 family)
MPEATQNLTPSRRGLLGALAALPLAAVPVAAPAASDGTGPDAELIALGFTSPTCQK